MLSTACKREMENYLCPDLIRELTDIWATYTDTCDAKEIAGRAVGMEPGNILDAFWPRMTGNKILARFAYHDGAQERVELKEVPTEIISMIH